jgi:hypothetical protein
VVFLLAYLTRKQMNSYGNVLGMYYNLTAVACSSMPVYRGNHSNDKVLYIYIGSNPELFNPWGWESSVYFLKKEDILIAFTTAINK